ncbi:hypothetical protein BMH32_14995 [Leucobacter sp. OLJS4]|uniref:hypothetical protein n=1 Tax=unclassified Leucobacter TaxID=2621730 RepID=UPI000C1897F1|nr:MULTISPECIES: hypothetical protein [unclassified Leucobacter]PIJ47979.1 hypothetical protein BMH30_06060 [Leucobacter sp. OLES1]PII82417.1 hypothetical protein BMH25_11115 [Leucobacter sp. OLCALW19]PII87402.1 hypothetical protein BMH26_09685 [Leucobacter sp. OLTLW20]PII94541.1 hypothetical protein BMH27_00715 [Leucobacter sp. OLAS13]PIJ00660.1 hypothetical protein BMH29_00800 [Leucobacter sp. OLDS2]
MSVDVLLDDQVALWLTDGRPDRMVWRSERWRVVDAPAPLADAAGARWRFHARSEISGALREFEARSTGGHWFVVAALAR